MKTLFGILSALILVVSFSSCQKEVDGSLPGLVQNDSIIIQQVIVLDTTFPVSTDTAIVSQISYDASKRISKDIFTQYNVGVATTPVNRHDYMYKYSGINNYPDYIIDDFKDLIDPSNNYLDTIFFTYSNGFVASDSIGGSADYIVTNFSKLSNTRYKMLQKSPGIGGGVYIDTTYIYTQWQNENLTKEIDSLWIPSFSLWDVSTATLVYDSKPNPFKNLVVPYPAPVNNDVMSFGIEALFLPTTNNIVNWADDGGTTILTYQYGSNGMPKIARDSDGIKVLYGYTKL